MSEEIGKLAAALSKAQGQMKGALKDAENPYFKSSYADLASVWEACRKALSDNELSVAQVTDFGPNGELILNTILMHSSGEKLVGSMPVMIGEKATAQQVGSAITYARRYALSAMVGVAPEDDDGNKASEVAAPTARVSSAAKFAASKPGESDLLKASVTEFVKKLEMAESVNELSRIIAANSSLVKKVEDVLPAEWSQLLQDKITQCRETFELAGS